jgi:hypothetical protein
VVEIVEQGSISFLATARPGVRAPVGPRDLDRLYVVLAPRGKPLRRLRVARRRLPGRASGQRFYAHVDRISAAPARLTEDLRAPSGRTATARDAGRGVRVLGVGRYAMARHADHAHLAWALARACGRGPLASAVGVVPGECWVLSVFSRSLPPPRRPAAGAPLAPATPERLDVIGVEVALVAGSRARDAALGLPQVAARDRVGDALLGALLRQGPRPRIASFARGAQARDGARRGGPAARPATPRTRAVTRG